MRFARTPRREGYTVTPRKVSAFERKKVAQRAALPLFAEATAATQISADEEMARRVAMTQRHTAERRSQIAKHWRDVRARYYALPPHIRAPIAAKWSTWTGPANSGNLTYIIQTMAAPIAADPEDFPHVSAEQRRAQTQHLNHLALSASPYARCERIHSPGMLRWLSPFFQATEDQAHPRYPLDTSLGRLDLLHRALDGFADFGHNSDPSGEHRAGFFQIEGTAFRFAITYHRPLSSDASRVPWNTDLTRRVLWIGLADEAAPIAPEDTQP
jgi:hypothetical protein